MAKKSAVTKGEWEGEIRFSGNKVYKRVYNGSSSRTQSFGEAVYYTLDDKSAEVVEQAATARLSLYCGVVNNPDAPDDDTYIIPPETWGWVCIQGEVPHKVDTGDFAIVAGEPLVGVNSKSEMISDGTRASTNVTIGDFSGLSTETLTIGGTQVLTEGTDWDAEAIAATATVTVVDYEELSEDTFTIVVPDTTTVLTEGTNWTAETDNDTTATSLALAINGVTGVGASATGNVITITATTAGTDGNNITIASSADEDDLELSGESLSGGIAGNNQTATNLAEAINELDNVMATVSGAVVTIRARLAGTAGNAITVVSSDGDMTVDPSPMEGGAVAGRGSRQSNSIALESVAAGEGVTTIQAMVRAFL